MTDPGTAVVVALVTAPSAEDAEGIARTIVGERLAACVNVLDGIASIFRWEGAVRRESEALLILKTTRERVEALRGRVLELHPYEVPEFLVLDADAVGTAYGAWVRAEVEPSV